MVIAITLRGFSNLGRSLTPIFLSMGDFLYRFSTFCEKMKKIYRAEVCFHLQNVASITETLLIREFKPTLNDTVSSEKLYLY